MSRQRNGKIARLPHHIREEVNLRLLNAETAPQILSWLNEHPDVIRVLATHFDAAPINDTNLSNWRTEGFRDWLAQKEKTEYLKTLSDYCLEKAQAGKHISKGAAAIVAGEWLTTLEALADFDGGEDSDPVERLAKITSAVSSLRSIDLAEDKIDLDRTKIQLRSEAQSLDREKFEKQTVEKFIAWAKSSEAIAIVESGKPANVQMSMLRKLMFGKEVAA